MSGAIPNVPKSLSAKQASKAYWWASLLDDQVHEHDCTTLREACLGSRIHAIQAVERLSSRVLGFLKKLPKGSLCVVFWENRRHRLELRDAPTAIGDEDAFRATFFDELLSQVTKYSGEIVRGIAVFPQYTGEYLSSIVAATLNQLHARNEKSSYSKLSREYCSLNYPFLDFAQHTALCKSFGAARHQQLREECMSLLSKNVYQDALRFAAALTLIHHAPEGRQHYWATCMAAVTRDANAIDVAEKLNFTPGVQGLMRARVLISRVARKTHDTYYQVLCSRKLMTIKLAEFMALEYRMPIAVVRESLRSIRLSSKRAELYAVSPPAPNAVPEID